MSLGNFNLLDPSSNSPSGIGGIDFKICELLGIKTRGAMQLVHCIRRGFSFAALEQVNRKTGLLMNQLAVSLGISSRTLSRRKKDGKISARESDRLVSIVRLFVLALELFAGEQKRAVNWLISSNRAFGGISPLALAKTETGAREVEDLIGRLEHGVFS